jgi:hypothetical protein
MPTFPNNTISGHRYRHYKAEPRDFGGVTDSWEYEDGGKDFNRRTSSPARRWRIEYGPLTAAQAAVFDTFWESVGIDVTFDFTDKAAVNWTNVRIESYERTHDAHKSWRNFVTFVIVKYP